MWMEVCWHQYSSPECSKSHIMSDLSHPSTWKYSSPEQEGLHRIIDPENSACRLTWIYRLNLEQGSTYTLNSQNLELNGIVIMGKVAVLHDEYESELNNYDSFYLPGNEELVVLALERSSLFIGGSIFEGRGKFFTREYDLGLPIGEIHQVHGEPPFQREVFMTLAQEDEGSRLICGITIGEYAMIGAGSVVTKDVGRYELVFGNPAKRIAYVCDCGRKLKNFYCSHCSKKVDVGALE